MSEKKQHDKLIDSIIESLGDEVEDIDELHSGETQAEETEGEVSESAETEKWDGKERRTVGVRKRYVTLATFLIIFAVIGMISSAIFVRDTADRIISRQALKDEFALFVYPVVINDPASFDSVDNLPSSTIITCAIWKILLTGDRTNYTSEGGIMYIPETDVESSAHSIFGIGKFDHRSVSRFGIEFIYNFDNKNYAVQEDVRLFNYSPYIADISNSGDLYTVTVDYVEPSLLAVAGIEQDTQPSKRRIYTISRSSGRMAIKSIRVAEVE